MTLYIILSIITFGMLFVALPIVLYWEKERHKQLQKQVKEKDDN